MIVKEWSNNIVNLLTPPGQGFLCVCVTIIVKLSYAIIELYSFHDVSVNIHI